MFADDTKLFNRVTSDREVSELQTHIDAQASSMVSHVADALQ